MQNVKVQIITIGDELLIGQTVDTNSAWMGELLTKEGFVIDRKISIGDNKTMIEEVVNEAFKKSDVVLLTGGLGPTKDDITLKTLAGIFNSQMVFNQEVYDNVERIILPRVGSINKLNRSQAYVPDKARVFVNAYGTAPILWFQHQGKVLVSMPGVPYEMKQSMTHQIVPALKEWFNIINVRQYQTIVVAGITEAELAEILNEFEENLPANISLAYLPTPGYIKLRLSGIDAKPVFSNYLDLLKTRVKEYLVSENLILPEQILASQITRTGQTIATAESCTGGLIAHKITSVPGSSEYFKGSIVAYDNSVKVSQLNVDPLILETFGAVSEEVVVQMALGVCAALNADIGIATSGIAGPGGGTSDKPVGTIWVAWCIKGKCFAQKLFYPYSREVNTERTAVYAIMQVVKSLQQV